MSRQAVWIPRFLAASAVLTWAVANGMDLLSMLSAVQFGGGPAWAPLRPAEFLVIYAGLRLLGAIAIVLLLVFVVKHWPAMRSAAWSALTACAFLTAVAAWWRLHG
jgi:hypothetical protein